MTQSWQPKRIPEQSRQDKKLNLSNPNLSVIDQYWFPWGLNICQPHPLKHSPKTYHWKKKHQKKKKQFCIITPSLPKPPNISHLFSVATITKQKPKENMPPKIQFITLVFSGTMWKFNNMESVPQANGNSFTPHDHSGFAHLKGRYPVWHMQN